MPYLTLATGSTPARYNGERLVNLIPHRSTATSPVVLLGRTGLVEKVNLGGPVRAMVATSDAIYAAASGRLWKIEHPETGVAQELGFIKDSLYCRMAAGSSNIAVCSYDDYRVWDGSTLDRITSVGGVSFPAGVTWMDGRFVVWGRGSGRGDVFQVSTDASGKTFSALDMLFAESVGDKIRLCLPLNGLLWVFGSDSIETWYNAAKTNGLFAKASAHIERGTVSGQAIAKDERAIYFVGNDGRVYRAAGAAAQPISPAELEGNFDATSLCLMVHDRGHSLLCVSRRDMTTLACDVDTGAWFEFSTGADHDPWIGQTSVTFNNTQYIGTDTGISCMEGYRDNGEVIAAEVVTPPAENAGQPVQLGDVVMDLQSGSDVSIMARFSGDGVLWGREKWRHTGEPADYRRFVKWRAQGQFDRRVQARFKITDNGPRDMHGVVYG